MLTFATSSPSFQPFSEILFVERFLTSMYSALGNPIEGEGSAIISVITRSNLSATCASGIAGRASSI